MPNADSTYDELTQRISSWAQSQRDVRGIAVVGSRGGGGQPDKWSDLDLVVVSKRPKLLVSCSWVAEIDDPWLIYPIASPDGERRATGVVFREGQATIDFAFVGARSLRAASILLSLFSRHARMSRALPAHYSSALGYFAHMLSHGARVILDKDGVLSRLASADVTWPHRVRPTDDEFLASVHAFIGASLWTAKKIRRGDLWRSAVSANHDLKQLLLQMIEWHSRLLRGAEWDTPYLGRNLDGWADRRIVESLPELFPHYTAPELYDSLVAGLELHAWIAREVAGGWRLSYPQESYARVRRNLSELSKTERE
jgi:aminoglycoside 6-adenylyltransferase